MYNFGKAILSLYTHNIAFSSVKKEAVLEKTKTA